MDNILCDFRLALRLLIKNPAFTIAAVLPLALAIGANTAIFSVVDAVLLSPFPYMDPERLVFLWGSKNAGISRGISGPNLESIQKRTHALASVEPFLSNVPLKLGLDEGDTRKGTYVGARLFDVLGISPLRGQVFSTIDKDIGTENVAVLSHRIWATRFGSERD